MLKTLTRVTVWGAVIGVAVAYVVHGQVKTIPVPMNSRLAHYAKSRLDNFPVDACELPAASPTQDASVDTLVRMFDASPLFSLEKLILNLWLGHATNLSKEIKSGASFRIGDQLGGHWKVQSRTNQEILFTWSMSGAHGATWFEVVKDPQGNDVTLFRFGSGIADEGGNINPMAYQLHYFYSKALLWNTIKYWQWRKWRETV